MKVSLYQYSPGPEPGDNAAALLSAMERAAGLGAELICTPEICLNPFFPQFPGRDAARHAISIDDEIVTAFQKRCRRLKLAASPNIYLREGDEYFDASLFINAQGELVGISKMVHICQAPGFYEQDYYTPSDTGFRVYDTDIGKVGIVICFDRHFPESIRTCVLQGAQIILIPTANTSAEPRDLFEWELRVAAMQNGVYLACCNRVGVEGKMQFYGESTVVDPHGSIAAKAGEDEELLVVDIDLSMVGVARRDRPYLDLRRPETYRQ